MSFINLTTPPRGIHNGKMLSFIAPCDSNELEGLSIDGKNYPLVDGMGNSITECGKVFKKDSIVTVTINTLLQLAVIDTNSFSTFVGVTDDSTENGSAGLVPAPLMTDKGKFLGSSGKWEDVSSVIGSFIDVLPSILSFENITVPVSSFIQVNEELYKANITLEHCTEKYFPIIKFEDDKGVMTKECETSLNTLTVYATALPDGDVVLSSVLLIGNGYVGGDPVIAEYSSNLEFPMQGQEGIIYLAKDENVLYRWDTILGAYVTLTSSGSGLTDEEKAKVDALPNPSIMSNLLIGGTDENDEITDNIKETLVSADILGNKYTVAILDRTFAEINEIMSNISDFTNKDILEKFSLTEDGKLLFDGNEIGVTLSNKELLEKFSLTEDGKLLFDGNEIAGSSLTNKEILEKFSVDVSGNLLFNGNEIAGSCDLSNKELLEKFSLSEDGKLLFDGNQIGNSSLTNKEILEKFSIDNSGNLLFDGNKIKGEEDPFDSLTEEEIESEIDNIVALIWDTGEVTE